MKNLKHELKNLNMEYNISSDFKDKVMKKIKEDEKNESINTFYSTITKIAYAAAIIVVCAIFVRNSNNINDTKNVMSANDASASKKTDAHAENSRKNVLSSDNSENVITNEMFDTADVLEYTNANKSADFDVNKISAFLDIEELLIQNNISIFEKGKNYFIVESEKETIEKLLESYDCQIEVLDDDKIKIIF